MASCTAIAFVEGVLVGDPLDVKMFQSTGWTLNDSPSGDALAEVFPEEKRRSEFGSTLVRRFDFSAGLQRMSVVCNNKFDGNDSFKAFVKGSPEQITKLCLRDTVPGDFRDVLHVYSQAGYRVIALAYKEMPDGWQPLSNTDRADVESQLTFLGLLIMENKLKPVTKDIIRVLKEAEVTPIMATGDNVLTAISVAGQCGIIDDSKPIHFGDLHTTDNENDQPWISWHLFGSERDKDSIMLD